MSYTTDLHETLLATNCPLFRKCWRCKFDVRSSRAQVDGCVEPEDVANNFARYYAKMYALNSDQHASSLYNEYMSLRANYFGFPMTDDTKLVDKVMFEL